MPVKRGIHMHTQEHRFFGFWKGILVGKLSGDEDADGEHWHR